MPPTLRASSAWRFALVALALAGCASGGAPAAARAPADVRAEEQVGVASYYARRFHGRRTASGERYDERELTAAHPTLPFGTRVRVTHLATRKQVVVRINDRGPHTRGRILDVSLEAARVLSFVRDGLARVSLEVLGETAAAR